MTYKTGAALVVIAVTAAVLISYLAPARKKDRVTPAQRYQTIDELLAPKLRQGWTLLSAPEDDGGLYMIGGFAYSAPELAGRSWTPSFRSQDEVLEYTVDIPDGKGVSVVGLQRKGDGRLDCAVLARDIMEQEVSGITSDR